jgi:arylsulfatase A-like enzyme
MTNKRPNIVITISDDQPYYDISGLGNTEIHTPAQERMMERGTCFERVYHGGATTSAVCCPSRAQLFSGIPLMQIPNILKGWWEDDADKFEAPNDDPACAPQLGEILRRNGYHCYGVGKWHNFPASYIRNFNDGGAIYFCGGNLLHDRLKKTPNQPMGKYAPGKPEGIKRGGHWNKTLSLYDGTGEYSPFMKYVEPRHSTDAFSENAIEFIDNYDGDKPFFLYCAFTAPHGPMKTDKKWHDMYPTDKISLPKNYTTVHAWDNGGLFTKSRLEAGPLYTEEESKQSISDLYAITTHEDEAIGNIHDALERNGLMDNTIVIHTGDHGKSLGHHGLQGKYSLYEHSIAIPLLMQGPGIAKGKVRNQLAYQHDLFPTILEAAGIEIPETNAYESLTPLLADGKTKGRKYIGTLYKDCQRMIRDERWKLIAYNMEGNKHIQLFDLQEDPDETKNLAGETEMAETIDRLLDAMRNWQTQMADPFDVAPANAAEAEPSPDYRYKG